MVLWRNPCFARLCVFHSSFLQLLLCFSPPLLCFASFSCKPVLLSPGCVWLPGQGWFGVVFLLLGASSGSPGNGGAQAFKSFCAVRFLQFSLPLFLLKVEKKSSLPLIGFCFFFSFNHFSPCYPFCNVKFQHFDFNRPQIISHYFPKSFKSFHLIAVTMSILGF